MDYISDDLELTQTGALEMSQEASIDIYETAIQRISLKKITNINEDMERKIIAVAAHFDANHLRNGRKEVNGNRV